MSTTIVFCLLLAVTAAAAWAAYSRRSLWIAAVVLEVVGVLLLGLPGAAFLETLQPLMERAGRGPISSDAAWPAAIVMSAVWPVALLPAYRAARAVSGSVLRGVVMLAVLSIASFAIGVLVYGMAN